MSLISIVLLVVIVFVALLLVWLILLQGGEDDGMGGMLGGQGTQAFGAKSGNVLTKTTGVLAAIFLCATFALGLLNKSPKIVDLKADEKESEAKEEAKKEEWWKDAASAESGNLVVEDGATVITDDGSEAAQE